MRRFVCCLLLRLLFLGGVEQAFSEEEYSYREMMAPLMPLSEEPPLEVDLQIRRKFLMDTAAQNRAAAERVRQKQFPWFGLLAFLAVLGAVSLARLFPQERRPQIEQERERLTKQQLQRQIAALAAQLSKSQGAIPELLQLDNALRSYMYNAYKIPLQCTTEEFLECSSAAGLERTAQMNLLRVLQKMDRIKFAKYVPGAEEMREVGRLVATVS